MIRLSMDERQTLIGLLRLNWPERRIAQETGFDRAAIRRIAIEIAKPRYTAFALCCRWRAPTDSVRQRLSAPVAPIFARFLLGG
jgi:hypothetical protein